MKLNTAQMVKALDAPSPDVRLYVLYGQDESEARALAQRLERTMGADAERIDLDAAALKSDPARLADEAASISLFGGKRHIRITLQPSDDILNAVEALLTAPEAGNPVVILLGAVKDSNALIKRVANDPRALVSPCYPAKPEEIENHAIAMARDAGLRLPPDIAKLMAHASGNDRAIVAQEVEKLALYLDAAPDAPKQAEMADIEAIGAGEGEAQTSRLVNAVLGGNPAQAALEAERLEEDGLDGIALIRAFKGRMQMLNKLAPQIAAGRRANAVVEDQGKAIFWMEKPHVTRQLERWPPDKLATANIRLLEAERAVKAVASAGPVLVAAELIRIARVASRGR